MAAVVGLLLVAPVLAGCAVGPDYRMPTLALPTSWSETEQTAASEAPDLSAWWSQLRDPVLDSLIADAVAGNLDVATATAAIREARASARQTNSALYPSVDGSGSAARRKSAGGAAANQFQAGFDASWEVDIFGGNRRAAEAALYGVEAAEENLRTTLLTLIGDLASAYIDARGYQARIALAQRTAASQRESAELTRTKYEAGASSGVDVANAIGQANSTEANIASLESDLAQTVHRLSILAGRAPGELRARMALPQAIPTPVLPVPTGVPADVLAARPDVRRAERQLAQSTAQIGEAEAARYPGIRLVGSISTTGDRPSELGGSTTIGWSFGPSLTLPIFNAGELEAAVAVAEAQRDASFLALKSAVLTALEDVENASVALASERRRNERLSRAVEAYREAASLSRDLYETGSTSFLEVLDAERSLYSAENSLIANEVAITQNYIALNKALGGGWDGAIDISSSPAMGAGDR